MCCLKWQMHDHKKARIYRLPKTNINRAEEVVDRFVCHEFERHRKQLHMGKRRDKYLDTNPWAIIETGFHPGKSLVSESIFSVANEYMGVRGYFEEGYSGDRLPGSYFNGVWSETDIRHAVMYKGLATSWTFMVNAVDWLFTRIRLDGETLDLATCECTEFRRTLDMMNGLYTREFTWLTKTGKQLSICFTRFVSMATPNLGTQKISLKALNFDGVVEIDAGLDFSTIHQTIEQRNHWCIERQLFDTSCTSIMAKAERSHIYLYSSFRLAYDAVPEEENFSHGKLIGKKLTFQLEEDQTVNVYKLVLNHTDKKANGDPLKVWEQGSALAKKQEHLTYDQALLDHTRHWNKVWDDLDIEIEGDADNQQGIRFCLFQLYQTNHGQDGSNNIGAKGLTGEIYSGHTFWDTEAYCLPFYLFTNPPAARNMLLFRHKTLGQAKEWSLEQNCRGACYPMETIDGRESCPVWWHGNLEIHVSGAVGYGIWHYYTVSGDNAFLYNEGLDVLIEICRFYASRGNWRKDGYGFYGVMGPDEFHTFINNNYYTNLLAKKIFLFTIDTIDRVPKTRDKNTIPDASELAEWKKMAGDMILPRDEKTGVYEQHEGYFLLPHIDIHSISEEEFPLYHHWTLPRIYRYDMIKQPDVLMALFLFSNDYSPEEKKTNYDFYEPRCIHESSLSPSIHSIIAAETGNQQQAASFFKYATRLDLDNYNRNTGEGLHITSMAAAWLNIVYGFAGMRSDGGILSFAPTMPPGWTKYSFSILYRGAKIKVVVTPEKAVFAAAGQIDELAVSVYHSRVKLTETPQGINLQ